MKLRSATIWRPAGLQHCAICSTLVAQSVASFTGIAFGPWDTPHANSIASVACSVSLLHYAAASLRLDGEFRKGAWW